LFFDIVRLIVDFTGRVTWDALMSSLATEKQNLEAKKTLLNLVNLGWLSRDLMFGTKLPEERIPLLAVSIKSAEVGATQTVLAMSDAESNEMTGIIWNSGVDFALQTKLVAGSSVLLKDASTGCMGHRLVSQYVVVSQNVIAKVAYIDAEDGAVRLIP
jgi:hypothetical protein